jgi:Transcriptional regulator, AbiEi antitoxin
MCQGFRMVDPVPEELRDIAQFQNGVVTRRQILESGLSQGAVRSRLDSGRWQCVHRGVFATFTGELPRRATLWAAVLRAGPGAMLSYQTAAEADGLIGRRSSLIHVTVPEPRHVSAIPGLVIHRSGRAESAGHPSRTPPRTRIEETVLDLAGSARSFDEAFNWLCLACAGRLVTPARLREAMGERGKMRWRAEISVGLDEVSSGVHSWLERRYLHDVERRHGLPPAVRQAKHRRAQRTGYSDILYEEYGVVVETDGQAAHPDTVRWLDAARDNAAAARGIITLRYPDSDIATRPCEVAAEVAAVLRRQGWDGMPRACGPSCPVLAVVAGVPPGVRRGAR